MLAQQNIKNGDENSCEMDSKLNLPLQNAKRQNVLQPSTKHNIKESPKKSTGKDPYSLIRQLDDNERWTERTSIITKQDHEDNCQFAREILDDVLTNLPVNGEDGETVTASCNQPDILTQLQSPLKTDSIVPPLEKLTDSGVNSLGKLPTDNYSMDGIDDNTNPFQTKGQILNSPPPVVSRVKVEDTDDLLSAILDGLGTLNINMNGTTDSSDNTKPENFDNPTGEQLEYAIKSTGYSFDNLDQMSNPFQTTKQLMNSPVTTNVSAEIKVKSPVTTNVSAEIKVNEKKDTCTEGGLPVVEKAEKDKKMATQKPEDNDSSKLDDKQAIRIEEPFDPVSENIQDIEIALVNGSYNIDFNALDENSDPFQCKKQIMNSPVIPSKNPEQEKNNSALDPHERNIKDTDPKCQSGDPRTLSPGLEIHQELQPRQSDFTINLDEIDETAVSLKPPKQIINSPLRDEPQATYTINLDEIDENAHPFKSKMQICNSPVKADNVCTTDTAQPKTEKECSPSISETDNPLKTKTQLANSPTKEVSAASMDEIDNIVDPFTTKSKVTNSPAKQADVEDISDPCKVGNSPISPGKQAVLEETANPFMTKSKIVSSPAKSPRKVHFEGGEDDGNPAEQTVIFTADLCKEKGLDEAEIDPFKSSSVVANSPKKSPSANPSKLMTMVSPKKALSDTQADQFKPQKQIGNSPTESSTRSPGGSSPQKKENTPPRWQNANSISKSPTKIGSPPRRAISATQSTKQSTVSPHKSVSSPARGSSPTRKPSAASPTKSTTQTQKKSQASSLNRSPTGHLAPMSPILENPTATPPSIRGRKKSSQTTSPATVQDSTDLSIKDEDMPFADSTLDQTVVSNSKELVPERPHHALCYENPLPDISEEDFETFQPASEVFSNAAFDDPSAWDMLERVGSNQQDKESELARMSLYVKFDPLVKPRQQVKSKTAEGLKRMSYSSGLTSGRLSGVGMWDRDENLLGTPPKAKAVPHTAGKGSAKIADRNVMSGVDEIFTCNSPANIEHLPVVAPSSGGELVDLLQYSDNDMKKLHQELELKYQSDVLIREREWDTKNKAIQQESENKIAVVQEQLKALEKELEEAKKTVLQKEEEAEDIGLVLADYKKTITENLAEIEKEKMLYQQTVERAMSEKDKALEDATSLEKTFFDFHNRYEKMKTTLAVQKQNEETCKKTMAEQRVKLEKITSAYKSLKEQAEDKLLKCSLEIDKIQKNSTQEVMRLEALVKKHQFKIDSLEKSLKQKVTENEELTQLCDDLIAKVGS